MAEQVAATTADGVPRRRGRPGYDLEAVLGAAVEVFNERGYDGASMEDLSKRLGIAKSGIYHHVSGKEELLRMALDRALDGLWEAAERAQALDEPAIVRLETLVRDGVILSDETIGSMSRIEDRWRTLAHWIIAIAFVGVLIAVWRM